MSCFFIQYLFYVIDCKDYYIGLITFSDDMIWLTSLDFLWITCNVVLWIIFIKKGPWAFKNLSKVKSLRCLMSNILRYANGFYNPYLYNFVFIENKASSYLQIGLDSEKIISQLKTFYRLNNFYPEFLNICCGNH